MNDEAISKIANEERVSKTINDKKYFEKEIPLFQLQQGLLLMDCFMENLNSWCSALFHRVA